MRKLSIQEAAKCAVLACTAKCVPLIEGEAGMGKSEMAKSIAKAMDALLVTIDCNLLKEGEIGGLPMPILQNGVYITQYCMHTKLNLIRAYTEAPFKLDELENYAPIEKNYKAIKLAKIKLDSLHGLLATGAITPEEFSEKETPLIEIISKEKDLLPVQIYNKLKEDFLRISKEHKIEDMNSDEFASLVQKERKVVLFFDEMNRTTKECMSEIMNLILNREINGYTLPENCYVIAAQNPASSESYSGNNYSVTEMDSASKNRFIWLELQDKGESFTKSWTLWAGNYPGATDVIKIKDLHIYNREDYQTPIELSILNYIISSPDKLHYDNKSNVKNAYATPRSFEFASNLMRAWELNKNNEYFADDKETASTLAACIEGAIGEETYIDFITKKDQVDRPLISPEELLLTKDKKKREEILAKFRNENPVRMNLSLMRCLLFLNDKFEESNKTLEKGIRTQWIDVLDGIQPDIRVAIMKECKRTYISLNDFLYKGSSPEAMRYKQLFTLVYKAVQA